MKTPRKYCNSGIKIYIFLVFCWIHLRIKGKVGEIRESLSFTDSAEVTPIPFIINDVMAPSPRRSPRVVQVTGDDEKLRF